MSDKRDFLSLYDLTPAEARGILHLAGRLKGEPRAARRKLLDGLSIAIVLEKASTRTRVSFEVGCTQLGAHPVVVAAQGSQLGRGEPVRDTARVLSGYCDAIVYRTSSRARLEEMAKAKVPVINALSDDGHPVQVLSDVFTIEEAFRKDITGMHVAFVGDCSSNMGRSWVEAASIFDFKLTLAGPQEYMPSPAEIARANGRVTMRHDPETALEGCDVANTDVWAAMGQEDESDARSEALAGWTLNSGMLRCAKSHAVVLHCLPAHRGEEIDDDTIEGPRSRVWLQAENRLHVQKALLVWIMGAMNL